MIRFAAALAAVALAAAPAVVQNNVTVQSLISEDFVVVGSIPSNIGPGLFLQKKDKMFFCVVVETPTSTNVTTRYCKPVR